MPANPIETDYTQRRGEISAYGKAVRSYKTLKRLTVVVALLIASTLLGIFLLSGSTGVRVVDFIALCALGIGVFSIWSYTNKHFIVPGLATRKWIQQVCDGELDSRIDLPPTHSHFKELDFHTRNLSSSLDHLTSDMEGLVALQTKRLESQNQVVELLFQLTSDVAGDLDFQSVTHKICGHLSGWLDNADVAAYSNGERGELKLLATSGPNQDHFKFLRPVTDLPENNSGVLEPAFVNTTTDSSSDDICKTQTLRIPIFKYKEIVGMVEVIATNKALTNRREKWRVFKTVSEQLSVFVLKDTVLESTQNARLIKARTQLGAELHDSLAQTLLATGYQVKMLSETLSQGSNNGADNVSNDLQKIEGMIGEANAELRSLIGEYREPLEEHRSAEKIGKLISDFNGTSSIDVFFQLDDPGIMFTAREDTVVHRIIGEALNNANKYSDATTIRVYIRTEKTTGARSVLIEDDGKGFNTDDISQPKNGTPGDHIGLSIMRDRALSVGAILTIDSESEEGTRVFLKLPPLELMPGVVSTAGNMDAGSFPDG